MTSKRARVVPETVENLMYFARFIMEKDPFKERAPKEEEKNFRAMFGCSPDVALIVWYRLKHNDCLPENGTLTHLLWTLMYAKGYPKWSTMRRLTGKDPKTLRYWIGEFRRAIHNLHPLVVSPIFFCSLFEITSNMSVCFCF
jgi:hypothetical protein